MIGVEKGEGELNKHTTEQIITIFKQNLNNHTLISANNRKIFKHVDSIHQIYKSRLYQNYVKLIL